VCLTSYKAVARRRRQPHDSKMSHGLMWLEVTRKWRHLTGSHLEVTVEGRKLASLVRLTYYKAVACRRFQSRDREWRHITSHHWKWFGHDVILRGVPESCRKNTKTRVFGAFDFLQGCSSQEEAVTWQELTSRVPTWSKVTRMWRHLTGSHLEVAVKARKLESLALFTTYKAIACRRRQSCDRKWCHVISRDRKWPGSDVI